MRRFFSVDSYEEERVCVLDCLGMCVVLMFGCMCGVDVISEEYFCFCLLF